MPATAKQTSATPSPLTFTEDLEITVYPEDLEAEGWIFVGKSGAAPGFPLATPTTTEAVDSVRRWHDREHPGPWPWCDLEPCKDLK